MIPKGLENESTSYWLDIFEGWLHRAAINLDFKPDTTGYDAWEKPAMLAELRDFRRQCLIHLEEVQLIKKKRKERRKEMRKKIDALRDEFVDFYKYGASRSLRTDQEIWGDVEKILMKIGLNKAERLAVCEEFLNQGRAARKSRTGEINNE